MEEDNDRSAEQIANDRFSNIIFGVFISIALLTLGLFTFFLVSLMGDRIGVWQSGTVGFVIGIITLWSVLHSNSYTVLDALISLVITLLVAMMMFFVTSNAKAVGDKKRQQKAMQKNVTLVQSPHKRVDGKFAV